MGDSDAPGGALLVLADAREAFGVGGMTRVVGTGRDTSQPKGSEGPGAGGGGVGECRSSG